MRLDHDRESRFNHEGQLREKAVQEELTRTKSLISQEAYLTVLIDCDGATFSKDLVAKGEKGGQEAVELLLKKISEFAADNFANVPNMKVDARLYGNSKTIAQHFMKTENSNKHGVLERFTRGFNCGEPLFDFVETGSKECTRRKIMENYRRHIRNCHCRQVILGIADTDEYQELLEEEKDVQVSEKVTLLNIGASKLDKFTTTLQVLKIDELFSEKKSEDVLKVPVIPTAKIPSAPALARIESNGSVITGGSGSTQSTPALSWAAMTAQPFVPQATKTSTTNSTPTSTNAQPVSKAVDTIPRNKYGERVDKVDSSIPYQELQRIKKMKLCNIFYLQGSSFCNGNCGHSHTYPLKTHEKSILREVARMTPCFFKLNCDDPGCIYGHRCPQSKPNSQECFYKQDCRFWGWGHGIDDKVVKTTSVKG